MTALEWNISPWALLVFALLWFFDGSGLCAALIPAVAVHEAGHAIFLRLGGLRLRRISLGLFGFEMDYTGVLKGFRGAAAIAAGPLFGLGYTYLASFGDGFWQLSGGVSLALSIFNLLPVLPLDGGRLMALAAGERWELISRGMSLVLAAAGAWFWISKGWFSLCIMGLWLAWWNHKSLPLENL